MAHRSQCSSVGDNPLDPNYLPPHYREEYRLAIDALVENDLDGYYNFLQNANVVDFLSRPEIEHIKNTVQLPQSVASVPELTYHEMNQEGSSDTYWPLQSDLDAPGLDLGWPLQQHSFVGPTEVTTLVNPSDPEMPSIKEQARRLIKNAQQVIAVVMDMFTDVDIFSDLLDAAQRHVPVYILLDEQNAHHFVAMVTSCKVNLDMVHMLRVRTVSGITYFCRTGKSFKGQVMDRFLLVDCRAVLSGNYSFMWSFEKIHRCIAHLFLGELVATFDEEFRILFAQSQPLVVENSLVPMPPDSTSSYLTNQFGLKRSQSLRNPRGFLRHSELLGYPFGGDRLDTALPFRRDDSFRHSIEPGGVSLQVGKFTSHQMRMQQSFLEQGRPMIASRQLEMNTYKRHSYAEGTRESYSSSRQYMKHRVMNNLDEIDAQYQRDQQFYQIEGTGPETGRFDSLRSSGLYQLDQYSDPMYQLELEAPESHNVLSSEDLSHDPESRLHQGVAHFGQPNQKRPTLSHAYACQSSPTQLHPPDHKQMFPSGEQGRQSQDPSVKQGLRSWRINSYLNTYENAGEEGLQQPLGPDAFDEPQQQPENRQYNPEAAGLRFNTQEPPIIQIKPKLDLRPRFGKPILPDRKQVKDIITDQASAGTDSQKKSAITAITLTPAETDSEKEMDLKDSKNSKEISITKHESFRSRINPVLQRSSRLRSSLIFSSSKVEQHSSAAFGEKLQEDEENNSIRTSSIVAEILEKRRSFSREPFDWNKHKKIDEKDSKELVQAEVTSKTEEDPAKNTKEIKEESKNPVLEEKDITKQTEPSLPKLKTTSLDMNDPASRLQYFKELSIKRKNSKTEEALNKNQEPLSKKPDLSDIQPSTAAATVPSVSVTPVDPFSTTTTTTTSATATTVQIDSAAKPSVVTTKSMLSEEKIHKGSSVLMEESTDAAKKETAKEPKLPKPFPSPKFTLKPFKSSHTRRTSCGEDILTDATDAEKSELKKSRSLSSSSMPQTEPKESLTLSRQGSNISLNVIGSEGKDTKALDFLKKQTQRLKGFLGPKGEKKNAGGLSTTDDKQMKTVPEETSLKGKDTHSDSVSTSTTDNSKSINKPSPSRYQSSTSTVLFSSNLRDDTKVILEQISANSQKNRQELAKQADETGNAEGEKGGHISDLDHEPFQRYQNRNRFNRAQANPQERDSLLKRIESMRKEKKVYSRFEMGNNLG
ncbi:protein FAM83H [Pangasianodon hypophthalmus]|uniref:protein FAM83H n=1 Tax=Pangasianodon hypophthalmus TaxID=310915 RepID=UPI000EFFC59F|nr:protein FAM83H [Pangasianodon hypophthalmus]